MESSAGNEPKHINVPPGQLKTQIVGASPQQKEILLASLSGVGDRRIQTITVAKADPEWGVPDGVGLKFTPRREAADDMRTSWEAFLIGDAFARRSRELGLPKVAYVSAPNVGASAIGEAAGASKEEEIKAFATRLREEADRAGAKVREIEMLKPDGYAIAATLQVSDPAEFLDQRAPDLLQRLDVPPRDYDLRIVDSNGDRVSENWNAANGGSVWVRGDLEGCSPYIVSQPISYEPPPCPDRSPRRQ
jgi:hypothetical protein